VAAAASIAVAHAAAQDLSVTIETNGEYYVRVRANARPRNTLFFWPWTSGSTFGRAKFTLIP
jgi:hypothetical protein